MKVAQLIDTLNAGGAERVAVNYANMLSDEFEESFLVTTRSSGVLENELNGNVRYINLNKKGTFDFKAIKTLKQYLKTNRIVIVQAHTTSYFFAALTKLFYPKIKIIWHDHQGNRDEIGTMKQIPLIIASFFFNGIIVVNKTLELWARKNLLVKNIVHIENFISPKNHEEKKTMLLGMDRKRIVCVANLKKPKNHLFLLKSFYEAYKENSDWSLHLVGKDYDDSYLEELNHFISSKNLQQSIFIYGLKQDIQNILEQCEIGVIASTFEGLPMALLEYAYAKLAIITTDIGSCKELISERGLVVKSNNKEQLSEALHLLMNDSDLRRHYGEKIKEYIDENFSKRAINNKVLAFYRVI